MKEIKEFKSAEEKTQHIIDNEMKRPNILLLIAIIVAFVFISKNLLDIIRPVGKVALTVLMFFEIIIFAFMLFVLGRAIIFRLSFPKNKKNKKDE